MSGVTVKTITVKLTGQAKVGDRWIPAGDQAVSAEELEVLKSEGLLADAGSETSAVETVGTFSQVEFNEAVAAEALSLAGQAFDGELGRLEAEVREIVARAEAEAAELRARAEAAEGERNELNAQISNLEGQIAVLDERLAMAHQNLAQLAGREPTPAAEPTDTPPSEKAPKTAPKKGAGAATKG